MASWACIIKVLYNFIPVFRGFGAHYLGNVNSHVPEQSRHFSDQQNPLIFMQKWPPFFYSAKITQPRQKVELDEKKEQCRYEVAVQQLKRKLQN